MVLPRRRSNRFSFAKFRNNKESILINKKLMAVAVAGAIGAPGLAFAQAANVNIYGHLDGSWRTSRYTSNAAGTNAAQTKQQLQFAAPRWGLRGSEDLGGGLTAYFQLESGMNPDGRPITTDGNIGVLGGRDSYLGVRSTQWGALQIGGFSTAYSNIAGVWGAVPTYGHAQIIMGNTDTTGTAPNPNCNASVVGPTGAAVVTVTPVVSVLGSVPTTAAISCAGQVEGNATSFHRRTSNSIEYATPNFSGFVGKIGTAAPENAEPTSSTPAGGTRFNPKHWSYNLIWSGGPFSAGIGYETHVGFRAANANAVAGGLKRDAKDKGTTLGGKWNYGQGEVGIGWERLKYENTNSVTTTAANNNDFTLTNWVLNGNYKITAAGTISAGYSKTPGRKSCGSGLTDAAGTCGSSTGAKMLSLTYDHSLSKRTGLYAAYGKITNNGITTAAGAAAGATYNYIAPPLSNGGAGAIGGVQAGTNITTYAFGMKHNF